MFIVVLILGLIGCKKSDPAPQTETQTDSVGETADTGESTVVPEHLDVSVHVTLDGTPVEGVLITQGGNAEATWYTETDGLAEHVSVDTSIESWVLMAAHPDARIGGVEVTEDLTDYLIELESFDPSDNEDYTFLHPGTPELNDHTGYCSHCHVTINEAWYSSPHRTAASNPVVQDIYAGVASSISDQTACEAAGGQWWQGLEPGTRAAVDRCYLGAGTLPDLNSDCGVTGSCDDEASETGACADCHAPGIDGQVGGRDLLEAVDLAYDYGVHCDVCHKVAAVDLTAPAGVAGRLQIIRPSEVSSSPTDEFEPLTFGPYPDVLNPKMGSVYREHHHEASFCAGCHQYEQAALVPGTALDEIRWPTGTIPIHTTYGEWLAGPLADVAPCQSCHMPPDPDAGNTSDIQLLNIGEGITAGWWRPPGNTRRHVWAGPREADGDMLRLAASLALETETDGADLVVRVTTTNAGAGHAIPTGEPLRSLVLFVGATCEGDEVAPTGGHAIPDFGGYLAKKTTTEDWNQWDAAEVGMVVRVVRDTGAWHDYTGFTPFDASWTAADKGMPVEEFVGSVAITAVDGGNVTFESSLPSGDVAYLVPSSNWPVDGNDAVYAAGLPGFAFARVLADSDGKRMVPHHRAVDVISDNRLMPRAQWVSEHRFDGTCETLLVKATLVHRAYPHALADERGWALEDSIMVEEVR